MKNQKLLIWENSQNIKNHRLAYESFISSLKINLDHLKAITGQKIDERMFQDILKGCDLLKKNLITESEAKIQKEPDSDLKEFFAEKLQAKIKKIDIVYQEIKAAKETKSSSIDSVYINNELLSFKNGHIIFNDEPVVAENSIFIDSEAKRLLYSQAENIKTLIEEFEKTVQELTAGQFHCIHSASFSDRVFLQLSTNYEIEINPFAFDVIEG
jgi:hypothetical protein